jgi:hypothetical protein
MNSDIKITTQDKIKFMYGLLTNSKTGLLTKENMHNQENKIYLPIYNYIESNAVDDNFKLPIVILFEIS